MRYSIFIASRRFMHQEDRIGLAGTCRSSTSFNDPSNIGASFLSTASVTFLDQYQFNDESNIGASLVVETCVLPRASHFWGLDRLNEIFLILK